MSSRRRVDRVAAEWVLGLGHGASLKLMPSFKVTRISGLPRTDFSIRDVNLIANPNVTDDSLKKLSHLYELRTLRISYTAVTDNGLQHLQHLSNLQALSLKDTKVTDAGLKHLGALTKLSFLQIQKTKVTEKGIKYLKMLLPDCHLDH